jgi:hypothetical protein
MRGLRQHTILGIVVGLCGVSGNTLYWVLLLVHVGSRATHFTVYCCWFMWGLGQHTLLGIVFWFTWASGNTHYWVLLLVYVGPRATHFTGYCCWLTWGLGQHTFLDLMWDFSNGFKIIFFDEVEVSISVFPPKPLIKQITPSQTKSYATPSLFPN